MTSLIYIIYDNFICFRLLFINAPNHKISDIYIERRTFEGFNFFEKGLTKGEYENCIFTDCVLANGDLSNISFNDHEFINCDFSTANIVNTAFREVKFIGCKMLGLRFDTCNEFFFSSNFKYCQLNLTSFYKLSLKTCRFEDCSLQEVDFGECDLTKLSFDNCDLSSAIFENTILEKADFRTAFNFSIDPETNRINKAKFSALGLRGLLGKYDIEVE